MKFREEIFLIGVEDIGVDAKIIWLLNARNEGKKDGSGWPVLARIKFWMEQVEWRDGGECW